MKLSMIGLIVLLALVAAFAVQNPGIITVRFLHLTGATSLLVVIVAGFGAGVLGGWLAGLPGFFRRRSEAAAPARRGPGPEGGGGELEGEKGGSEAAAAARRILELEAEVVNLKGKSGGQTPSAPEGTT